MSLLMQLILNRDNEVNNTAFSEPFDTNMILYRPQRSEEDSDKWQRGEPFTRPLYPILTPSRDPPLPLFL